GPFVLQPYAWSPQSQSMTSQGDGPHDPVDGMNLSSYLWRYAGDRETWVTMRKMLIGAQYLPVTHHEFLYGDHRTHFFKPRSAGFDFEEYDGFDDARPFMRHFNNTKKELYGDGASYVKTEIVFDWRHPNCLLTVHHPEEGKPNIVLIDSRDPYKGIKESPADIALQLYHEAKGRQNISHPD